MDDCCLLLWDAGNNGGNQCHILLHGEWESFVSEKLHRWKNLLKMLIWRTFVLLILFRHSPEQLDDNSQFQPFWLCPDVWKCPGGRKARTETQIQVLETMCLQRRHNRDKSRVKSFIKNRGRHNTPSFLFFVDWQSGHQLSCKILK